ncbi:hypothetical protein UG55_10633 [Frankia sp. EI5c]|nr:DLW-39 family protein [Frankia sp. EI5c]OAA21293.1 hypothetical protein UG55_10633 [Frankia sp. EI5c]
MRKFTVVAVAASAGALLTVVRRRRDKDEIDLWREATSTQGNR